MDDMKVMMQNELREALAELIPPLAPAAAIPPAELIHMLWMLHPLTIIMLGGNL